MVVTTLASSFITSAKPGNHIIVSMNPATAAKAMSFVIKKTIGRSAAREIWAGLVTNAGPNVYLAVARREHYVRRPQQKLWKNSC